MNIQWLGSVTPRFTDGLPTFAPSCLQATQLGLKMPDELESQILHFLSKIKQCYVD